MENKKIAEELLEIKGLLVKVMGAAEQEEKAKGKTNREGKNDICCFLCIWVLILEMASILKGLEGMVCMDMHYNICIIRYAL